MATACQRLCALKGHRNSSFALGSGERCYPKVVWQEQPVCWAPPSGHRTFHRNRYCNLSAKVSFNTGPSAALTLLRRMLWNCFSMAKADGGLILGVRVGTIFTPEAFGEIYRATFECACSKWVVLHTCLRRMFFRGCPIVETDCRFILGTFVDAIRTTKAFCTVCKREKDVNHFQQAMVPISGCSERDSSIGKDCDGRIPLVLTGGNANRVISMVGGRRLELSCLHDDSFALLVTSLHYIIHRSVVRRPNSNKSPYHPTDAISLMHSIADEVEENLRHSAGNQ